MSKHTPGPWDHNFGRIFHADRRELTIANVGRATDGDYSEANARLIAAAPDLLDVLESLVNKADEPAKFFDAVIAARAAIAKARGETT